MSNDRGRGRMSQQKQLPVSLDELERRRKEENEAKLRPRFISSKQRHEIEERMRSSTTQKQTTNFETRMDFEYTRNTSQGKTDSGQLLETAELQAIKERYMGHDAEHKPKKSRRFTEMRFAFDWEASDDTSQDPTALNRQVKVLERKDPLLQSKRDRHWSEKRLDEMEERDWRIFREDYNIATQGGQAPFPIRNWDEARDPISSSILRIIRDIGYEEPTPIQRQAIPITLAGRDLVGIAETGSGKTAAFVIPMVSQILRLPKLEGDAVLDGPYGLVLVPTRELALQIEKEASKFTRPLGLSCRSIVGGQSITGQSFHMRMGVEIVVATPGRLRDCLEQRVLVLSQCRLVVLDEADRMIDMNYEEDLHFILDSLGTQNHHSNASIPRQTTVFSATMPAAVEKLIRSYLIRPLTVIIGQIGKAVDSIEQRVHIMTEGEKISHLSRLLENFEPPIIIFVNQKTTVDMLYSRLSGQGYQVAALHGGKGQEQRELAISQLRNGTKEILLATDVASRGLDINNVSMVINYDMSKSIEDYVHRVGRTGRAGRSGIAVSFLTEKDSPVFYDLKLQLEKSAASKVPSELANHEAARVKPGTVVQKRRHEERVVAYGL